MDRLRRPLGLFLPGGGSLGSWQAAALFRLAESGVEFDAVQGFSIGALNGACYALGRLERGLEIWKRTDGGAVRFSPRLRPFSLCEAFPVWDQFAQSEEELRRALRLPLTVISVSRRRRKPVYAVFTPRAKRGWDAPLRLHLAASSAIPGLFPPVRVPYRGCVEDLVDGGVRAEEPIDFSALDGCRDIVVIWPSLALGERRRPAWLESPSCLRVREALQALLSRPRAPRVLCLRPSRRLGFRALDFRAVSVRHGLWLGSYDAETFRKEPGRFEWPSSQTSPCHQRDCGRA